MKTLIKHNSIIDVPFTIAVCPYCNGLLSVTINSYSMLRGEQPLADEIELKCVSEEFRDKEQHSYMPYVYWLPIEMKVMEWLNSTYEFDLVDWDKN